MNVALINPFLVAIHGVFDTMVHVPVKLGKPILKRVQEPSFIVSATIMLSGSVNGTVALRLSQRTALALASGLAGVELKIFDDDCLDAIGEIASIVSGSAKKELSAQHTNISIPKINLGIPKREETVPATIVIPCLTKVGDFALEVSLSETLKT